MAFGDASYMWRGVLNKAMAIYRANMKTGSHGSKHAVQRKRSYAAVRCHIGREVHHELPEDLLKRERQEKKKKETMNLGMYSNCNVSCGKNKQVFQTSERKCHGEFPPFLNTVCLGTSTRRGLELLLLLPGRADIAQTVISGTGSHPDYRTGGLKGWFCRSTSCKNLKNNFR